MRSSRQMKLLGWALRHPAAWSTLPGGYEASPFILTTSSSFILRSAHIDNHSLQRKLSTFAVPLLLVLCRLFRSGGLLLPAASVTMLIG
jgi:hypothetical protein